MGKSISDNGCNDSKLSPCFTVYDNKKIEHFVIYLFCFAFLQVFLLFYNWKNYIRASRSVV